jgi:hypothetical protein
MSSDYVKVERPEQVEPGDHVYEIVRFGTRETDVKYNELRVMSVEGKAVRAVRVDGARSQPVKIAFHALVMRADPPRTGVVRRLPERPQSALVPVDGPPSTPGDAFSAYIDMSRELLDELRSEIAGVSQSRARVVAEIEPLEAAHRKQVESLETQLASIREQHQRERAVADAALGALDARRAALDARINGLEAMLKAVNP